MRLAAMSLSRRRTWSVVLSVGLVGCVAPTDHEASRETSTAPGSEERVGVARQALSSFDCHAKSDTGYEAGQPFPITVVTVDGELVERNTANAYYFMAKAAANDGVQLHIVSGFRTMAEQQYLYGCYVNCNCNNCNLAAKPGYSNHQSGEALDLNTSQTGVLSWLNAHGDEHGFVRTVPSEAWHWEYKGSTPVGGPCGTLDAELVAVTSDAPADPESKADHLVCAGEGFSFQIEMRNIGTARWAALGDGAEHVGERVRLFPEDADTDLLTGKASISVADNLNDDVLPASWGGGAGAQCNDAPGCRRTIFADGGMVATAPLEPGVYPSRWRLYDLSPVWNQPHGFGPVVELSVRAEVCSGEGPLPGGGGKPPDDPSAPAPAEPADTGDGGGLSGSVGCALAPRVPRGVVGPMALLALAALWRRRYKRSGS